MGARQPRWLPTPEHVLPRLRHGAGGHRRLKYLIKEPCDSQSPWARTMRPGLTKMFGEDATGDLVVTMLMATLAPGSYRKYHYDLEQFRQFCSEEAVPLLDVTVVQVVRYLAWQCEHGSANARTLRGHCKAINRFLRDHGREPCALGPLVTDFLRAVERHQVPVRPDSRRMYMPADVMLSVHDYAEELVARLQVCSALDGVRLLRACLASVLAFLAIHRAGTTIALTADHVQVQDGRLCLALSHEKGRLGPHDRTVVIHEHPRLAAMLDAYKSFRATLYASSNVTPPSRLWALPGDRPEGWTAEQPTAWLLRACAAVSAAPPDGWEWSSHSLRSGAATAANAQGVPISTIEHYGGWVPGSTTLRQVYIHPGVLPSRGSQFFFQWAVAGRIPPAVAGVP